MLKQKTTDSAKAILKAKWYLVDAQDQTLGRLATQVATLLRGKDQPQYQPNVDLGVGVVVVNAGRLRLTGNKKSGKIYYKWSGYLGGLKSVTAGELLAKKPEFLFSEAVRLMMPKNRLCKQMLTRLRVYGEQQHPHQAQKLVAWQPRPLATAKTGKAAKATNLSPLR